MKRLIVLVLLIISCAACGSNNSDETNLPDGESQIETKVASTVAAALAEESSVEVAPTIPAISGDATPLTPIPQLAEEVAIEVSPEVEYAPEGGDGVLTFDFGGGATATSPTVSVTPLGGTAIRDGHSALTLKGARFAESYSFPHQDFEPQEGYRLLVLEYHLVNIGETLGQPSYNNSDLVTQIIDREGDAFPCGNYPGDEEVREISLVLPGYGTPFEGVCEIPITAAADELNGLRVSFRAGSLPIFEFDLGDHGGEQIDFADLRAAVPMLSIPFTSTDICAQEADVVYRFETPRWYDTVDAFPPQYVQAKAAEWSIDSSIWFGGEQQNRLSSADSSEERIALASQLWQEAWAPYDLSELDIVAIDLVFTNEGKQPNADPIFQSFASFEFEDPLSPFVFPSSNTFSSLILPFMYLKQLMPPGGEERTTLYAIVPESDNTFDFMYLFTCNNISDAVVVRLERDPFTPNEGTLEGASQPVPENLQRMIDDGAIEVIVDAGQPRTYTGIMLEERGQVNFGYLSGRWRGGPATNWSMVGPDGDRRVCEKDSFPLPEACLMNLIWGVGDSEPMGVIRSTPFGTSSTISGELWLGPNDDDYSDNGGSLSVLVRTN